MRLISKFQDYHDPNSLASRFRARRAVHLRALIEQVSQATGGCRIIDVGGARKYWRLVGDDFLQNQNATVLILNLEKQPWQPDDTFSFALANGTDLKQYEDASFDIAHSNSVIEHVGGWRDMVAYAAEIRRVARHYFVQTPNFWFPIEPHLSLPLIHWLPDAMQVSLLVGRAGDVDTAARLVDDTRLLNLSQFRTLFPDSELIRERFFLMTKSIMAIRR